MIFSYAEWVKKYDFKVGKTPGVYLKIKKIKIYQFTRKKIETKENWSVNKISKIEKGKINKGEEREKGLDVDFMNYRLIINWMFLYLKNRWI